MEISTGHVNSSITDELKGQSVVLRDSIDKLKAVDCARASLISLLHEALQEQVDVYSELVILTCHNLFY